MTTLNFDVLWRDRGVSRGLQQLGKDADKAKRSISDLSTKAGLLGAGLLVGVGAVLKSAAGFDKAMSSVAATGQDARNNIDGLRKQAIELGKSTKFSATEAAQGVESLLKAGVSAADVMGGGLKGSLDLAAAGNMEVGQAAEVAANAMNQFNLKGKDVPHIADLLAAAAGKSAGEVSDMADALKMSGSVANQFGLSIEETTGFLAAFAANGNKGSDAGTSFKQMLLQLGNPSAKAKGLMNELGISVYDANGNFLSLSGVAGELTKGLAGLTQEQRDQALATIFGSDAIRAANVLFKQGASGIDEWTKKVNEAGFAAQVARLKMDNLAGDLETLKGAIETAFIQAGSGANEALRGLTQEATRAVNAFSSLPAPVLETGVKLTTLAGIGLLTLGGIGKLTTGVVENRQALADLRKEAPKTASALGALGKTAAAVTGTMLILQTWGAIANEIDGEFTPSVDAAAGALLRLGMAGDRADLENMFRTDTAVNDINSLGEALQRATDPRWFDRLGSFADKLTGTSYTVASQLKLNFEAADKAINSLSTEQAADAFRRLAMQAQASGVPIEELVALFPQYSSKVRDAANSTGNTVTSTKQLADLMMNGVPPAAVGSAQALAKTANSTQTLKSEAKAAKQQLQDMIDKLFGAARAALELEGSEDGLEAAIDDATQSVKTNGKTLDNNTEKGRNNRAALRNLASASIAYREKLISQGASQKRVTNTTMDAREAFIKTAVKMGSTRKEAKELADKFGLLDREINDLNNRHVKIKFTTQSFKIGGVKYSVNTTSPSSVGRSGSRVEVAGHPGTELIPPSHGGGGPSSYADVGLAKMPPNTMTQPNVINRWSKRYADEGGKLLAKAVVKNIEASFAGGLGAGPPAFGRGQAAAIRAGRRLGADSVGTYPGHHPSMAKARDFMISSRAEGNAIAGHMWARRKQYGIWYVIWNRRIASQTRPGAGWAPYRRSNPHTDHVHVAWYDRGGMLRPGGMAANASGRPERVLSPAQTQSFDRLVRVMERGRGGAGNTYITIHAPNYVGSQDDLRRTLVDMNRRGQLEVIKTR